MYLNITDDSVGVLWDFWNLIVIFCTTLSIGKETGINWN